MNLKKDYLVWLVIIALGVLAFLFLFTSVFTGLFQGKADGWSNGYTVCHHTPSNQVTLHFNNLQSYLGHLGTPHSGSTYDTNGACQEPSATPTLTPTPTQEPNECEDKDCITPTVSPTPTEASPTATPSETPKQDSVNAGSDGRNDGLGCGQHDCSNQSGQPLSPNVGWK